MVRGMVRMLNAYIEAINNRMKLLKYTILVPDIDIINHMGADIESDSGQFIALCNEWILKNVETYTSRREFELFNKKPGALMAHCPQFIWIKILKWHDDQIKNFPIYGLRNKWNNTLEAMLATG